MFRHYTVLYRTCCTYCTVRAVRTVPYGLYCTIVIFSYRTVAYKHVQGKAGVVVKDIIFIELEKENVLQIQFLVLRPLE